MPAYSIRVATSEDLGDIRAACTSFADGKFDLDLNQLDYTTAFLVFGGGCIFLAEDDGNLVGLIACVVMPPQVLYRERTIANEPFWWVHPEYRNRGIGVLLMNAYENWAKSNGCHSIQCGALDNETGDLLKAIGFNKISSTFMKEL